MPRRLIFNDVAIKGWIWINAPNCEIAPSREESQTSMHRTCRGCSDEASTLYCYHDGDDDKIKHLTGVFDALHIFIFRMEIEKTSVLL